MRFCCCCWVLDSSAQQNFSDLSGLIVRHFATQAPYACANWGWPHDGKAEDPLISHHTGVPGTGKTLTVLGTSGIYSETRSIVSVAPAEL
jgi:hypothetical protein